MGRSAGRVLAGLWLVLTLAGCAHRRAGHVAPSATPPTCAATGSCPQLPAGGPQERSALQAPVPAADETGEVSRLPLPDQLPQAADPARPPPPPETIAAHPALVPPPAVPGGAAPGAPGSGYRPLTARECLCRAAGASSVAALLDQEAQAVSATAPRSLLGCRQGDRLADVHQSILRASAAEARNQAAATALELYYRLMEAQRRWQLVQDSLQQLTDALDKSADLERHGLKLPVDAEEFRRQKLQLEADQVQLQVAIERLDGDLRRALGWGAHAGGGPLWPATDFEVCADPMDVHEVVSLGLAGRPELVLLRQLEHQLDGQTLPAVRQLLRASNGLLGGAEQRARPCRPAVLQKVKQCLGADPPDLVARRQQLARYRADREQAIALEIHQAVRAVQGQTQVVFLARARAASWQKKVQELEERRAQGLVSFAETTQTNLEWSRARGDVLQAVTVWQLARVKLKQALGLLVQECSESSGQWSVVSEEQVEYQSPPAAGKRCFPDH